jgi:hypothetical protein
MARESARSFDGSRAGAPSRAPVAAQGLLMTAYLHWLGVAEAELSLWRGAGALAGVGATFAYPRLHAEQGAPAQPPRCGRRDWHRAPCSGLSGEQAAELPGAHGR